MNRRKLTIPLLLAGLVFILVACTPSATPAPTQAPATEAPATEAPQAEAPDTAGLAGTEWKLVSYGQSGAETQVPENVNVTLTLDEGSKAGGSSGCNSYGGNYQIDGSRITFGDMISTLMACADQAAMDTETAYLQALSTAESFELAGENLRITYAGGNVLVFEK